MGLIVSEFEKLKQEIEKKDSIIIYGAQNHAHCMYVALNILFPGIIIPYFMVTKKEGNPDTIENVVVKSLCECDLEDRNTAVMVAASGKYYDEIEELLHHKGFWNIINGCFGGLLDNKIRNLYFKENYLNGRGKFILLSELQYQNGDNKGICVYMAKSGVDKPLSRNALIPQYVCPVYAGAALSDKKIDICRDDEGENISLKNRNFCEGTVLYYIWKNAKEDYVGLYHYRRRFAWSEDDLMAVQSGEVDVVLPLPVITLRGQYDIHYRPYINEQVYQVMLDILEREYPEYYETSLEVMKGDLFYPCNVLVAKRDAFSEYARWMFDVLFKVEAVCGDETIREDRYLGYLAEHLTTFYFVHHADELKIVHSRMEILN